MVRVGSSAIIKCHQVDSGRACIARCDISNALNGAPASQGRPGYEDPEDVAHASCAETWKSPHSWDTIAFPGPPLLRPNAPHGVGLSLTGVFVTFRACARPLRTLTVGQNTGICQNASLENARRELSRARANFPCVITGLQQTRISDEHAK
jgi:hypothetical protein